MSKVWRKDMDMKSIIPVIIRKQRYMYPPICVKTLRTTGNQYDKGKIEKV